MKDEGSMKSVQCTRGQSPDTGVSVGLCNGGYYLCLWKIKLQDRQNSLRLRSRESLSRTAELCEHFETIMLGLEIYLCALVASVSILWRLCHQTLARSLMGLNFKVFALTISLSIFILFTFHFSTADDYGVKNKNEVHCTSPNFLIKLSLNLSLCLRMILNK